MTDKQRVINILKAVPATRNSDIELFIVYMQKAGMRLSQFQIDRFKELPDMQSIARIRRKLQEQGLYRADPEIEEARYEKYKHTRANIATGDPEELLKSQGKTVKPWGQG